MKAEVSKNASLAVTGAADCLCEWVGVVSSRLCNYAEQRRLVVDPRCRELIRDSENVRWREMAAGRVSGELDKRDPKRTHVGDALGYYSVGEFPVKEKAGEMERRLL